MILVMKAVSLAFDMDEAAPTDSTSETSTANEGKDQGESSEKSHQNTKYVVLFHTFAFLTPERSLKDNSINFD